MANRRSVFFFPHGWLNFRVLSVLIVRTQPKWLPITDSLSTSLGDHQVEQWPKLMVWPLLIWTERVETCGACSTSLLGSNVVCKIGFLSETWGAKVVVDTADIVIWCRMFIVMCGCVFILCTHLHTDLGVPLQFLGARPWSHAIPDLIGGRRIRPKPVWHFVKPVQRPDPLHLIGCVTWHLKTFRHFCFFFAGDLRLILLAFSLEGQVQHKTWKQQFSNNIREYAIGLFGSCNVEVSRPYFATRDLFDSWYSASSPCSCSKFWRSKCNSQSAVSLLSWVIASMESVAPFFSSSFIVEQWTCNPGRPSMMFVRIVSVGKQHRFFIFAAVNVLLQMLARFWCQSYWLQWIALFQIRFQLRLHSDCLYSKLLLFLLVWRSRLLGVLVPYQGLQALFLSACWRPSGY